MQIPRTTIEQWSVLQVVVQSGSFALAAEALNRSPSSISYTVNKLQQSLGAELMKADGRRAVLTDLGRELLDAAVPLIEDFIELEAQVRSRDAEFSQRLSLNVDSLFPSHLLFEALSHFSRHYPDHRVDLQEHVRRAVVSEAGADWDLAISMPSPNLRSIARLYESRFLQVARADHPLIQRKPTRSAMMRHTRVVVEGDEVIAGTASPKEGRFWIVESVAAIKAAILQGNCYGWIPQEAIKEELTRGEVAVLELGPMAQGSIPLELYMREAVEASAPIRYLVECLINVAEHHRQAEASSLPSSRHEGD
ncbi:LysR family transcriptional regulator [uncultured Cohaesibacter sp.]|uniref:LysR family transcriptional regulator n=1 Tax=uncultured Cohaesibacter sp. TaxID=1002546 RepID=UPI002AAB9315|nr:LysR family transcriptional regulator [uncultured Cohaesibacter sp.]